MIAFSKPNLTELEQKYVADALGQDVLSGDGKYTALVNRWFVDKFGAQRLWLTTSGTTALEMASLLIDLSPGDEVIVPSYTFSSTANAFILRGAKPMFCEIRTDTMNLDETVLESLITPKTKAIFPVAYAGVCCELDAINEIAKAHNLVVVEDAAQAVGSTYKGRPAGTLTDIGCYSFHNTKNYSMGEGGALLLSDEHYAARAEIIREKGTNRSQMLMGMVDKYTWHDVGSSYLPSDVLAALLYGQLERFDEIMEKRMNVWNAYHTGLAGLEHQECLLRMHIPEHCTHNAHMYYLLLPNEDIRNALMAQLKKQGIISAFHYIPLHSSPFGQSFGYRAEMLPKTEEYAARLLRLPLHTGMTVADAEFVCDRIIAFFKNQS